MKSAEKMMLKIVNMHDEFIKMIQESYLPEDMKDNYTELVNQRTEVLL